MGMTADDLYNVIQSGNTKTSAQPSQPTDADSLYNLINGKKVEKESTPWSDVLTRAYANIPSSAVEMGKGVYEAVTHPIQTAGGVMDLAAGTLHNITPEHIADWIDKADWNPEAKERAVQTANAVGHIYKNRYGSSEGFKEALATDPVGVASDVATLLSGGAGAASKTGLIGKVGEISSKLGVPESALNVAGKVAENVNPINATQNLVETLGKPTLGLTTGTGTENIANAVKAGEMGDKSFLQNLRGQVPQIEALNNARDNLAIMRQNKSNAYRSGMTDISADKSVLDFKDIDKALNEAKNSISFKGKTKDDVAAQIHDDLSKEINAWKNLDPAEYHTPEGLDALKQRIGAITNRIPYEEANSNRVGGNVYNAIKDTISKQAPKYAEVMSDYHEASDSIKEIEKALSLGNRASADTAIRKLQSLTRNNVNTNYGNRLSLAQQLEHEGGKPFINALSGQALSSPTARGLAGGVEGLTALAGFSNPMALLGLPFQTPRLVGEGLYKLGQAKGLAKKAGISANKANAGLNALSNLNKAKEEE
jgi:hypothetical protein